MPVEEHLLFVEPSCKDQVIWRYMDFTKFASLLDSESLHFSSQIALANIDPLEGSLTNIDIQERDLIPFFLKEHLEKEGRIISEKMLENFKTHTLKMSQAQARQRNITYINCWHMNDFESAAMWSQYLSTNEGIAITSTYEKLRNCLALSEERFFIGKVKYIDFNKDTAFNGNTLGPVICKRKSYEHERELRAVIVDLEKYFNEDEVLDLGKKIKINLKHLIKDIYISPYSADWIKDLIESLLQKYELSINVQKSDILTKPLF